MDLKISMSTSLFIRSFPMLLVPALYYSMVREGYSTFDVILPYILGGSVGGILGIYYILQKDIDDERAKKNKRIADSICYKVSIIIFMGILLPLVIYNISPETVGYIISFSIALIAILNVVIFKVIDYKGR